MNPPKDEIGHGPIDPTGRGEQARRLSCQWQGI